MHLPLADIPPALPFRDDNARLLAELSHEIRTPLTAMLGYADYLLDSATADVLSNDRLGALQIIQSNGRHLLELVNSILDWARLDAGGRIMQSRIDPVALAGDVVKLLRPRTSEVSLRLIADESAPRVLVSDPLRVRQILLNLLGNALKFTTCGEVSLLVEGRSSQQGASVRFEVRDTGLGMTEEQRSRLFAPFAQGDQQIAERFGGTGLGLAISRRLCELLGGELTVESTPGVGSVFRLDLPLQVAAMEVGTAPDVVPATANSLGQSLQNRRILLAEDSRDTRRLMALILRQAGAEVQEVDNGRDAYALALNAALPFDVVLMDVEMPVWSGLAAAQQLRRDEYPGLLIAISASEDNDHRLKCLQSGFDDYVAKPIERAALLGILASGLAKRLSYEEPQFVLTRMSVLDPH